MNTKNKLKATLLIAAGALLLGISTTQPTSASATASSTTSTTKSTSTRYDAQIVTPKSLASGYQIYSNVPGVKNTTGTPTTTTDSSEYNNQYVRVMQTQKAKSVTYAQIRLNGKILGWINANALKQTSFKAIAQATMQKYNAVGSVLVSHNKSLQPTLVNNGYANMLHSTKNTSDGSVLYPLASLQNTMTAAMIQQLINTKKLTATTTLSKYFPQVAHSKTITIQQLLTMTSGIKGTIKAPDDQVTEDQAYTNAIKALKSTNKHSFSYSDINYVLLAGVIAKVTGKSYTKNLQSRILNKLGMKNTYAINETQPDLTAIKAVSYSSSNGNDYQNSQSVSYPALSALPGAGNVLTTPSDYYKFVIGLQNGKVLTAKGYQQLTSYSTKYSGGMYVDQKGMKSNNGTYDGSGFNTGYTASDGNQHVAVVFLNQSPLKNNMTASAFLTKMNIVATYY
ncbi:serine hydrolase [Lentilactobacillus buchneri]|uniref:serine hydrolase n=1 Tax=Lentilactobacillus buchneri TaxID=1581 RepID=UPI0002075D9B|nr:serine hydrolase [Lentilactobacillus buchneri]AEB72376.1 beta-lactamase [Lentilactobacillus buchneri NRRL B-30929]MDS1016582.1 class A beta-lactamase-related serine hydrolase [Lentilactobacillus buchneri]MQM81595.1 penicillin-binding protein [Lentilactobacillus buchneri]MQN24936.1 penicillin-binding protein [Lentilactobacillus buchneri]